MSVIVCDIVEVWSTDSCTSRKTLAWAAWMFVHFLGSFLATNPHIDNVTDDHRYSRLLADFPSVGVGIILTVRFL